MQINLQDAFLSLMKKERTPIEIYLVNGYGFKGLVKGFDNFTIFVEDTEGKVELVYKHAISTLKCPRAAAGNFPAELFKEAAPGPAKDA
jgi:host factor-I protein